MQKVGEYWGIPGIWAIFAGAGVVSIVSAIYASNPRDVLLVIGVTGLFAGLLTYLVTPRDFVRASIVERLHDVLVANMVLHAPCAGRRSEYTYVPCDQEDTRSGSVLLFVSCDGEHAPGTSVYATGNALLEEFDNNTTTGLSDSPMELGRQIVDCLKNGLELVETATCTVEQSGQRATIKIEGSIIDTFDQFDDPITSFVGSAFAAGLDQSVTVETRTVEGGDATISCLWGETKQANEELILSDSLL